MFRRKYGSSFPDKWIPIIYQIITSGSTLNWGELISSNLDLHLKKYRKEHQFFMSSYLLDVMCASREYLSLGWRWEPNLSSIHVYCKMLWENRYRRIMNGSVMNYFPHFNKFCSVKKNHVYHLKGRK